MEKEVIAKNEKVSIALDTDGKIVIDAKEITTGSIKAEIIPSSELCCLCRLRSIINKLESIEHLGKDKSILLECSAELTSLSNLLSYQ